MALLVTFGVSPGEDSSQRTREYLEDHLKFECLFTAKSEIKWGDWEIQAIKKGPFGLHCFCLRNQYTRLRKFCQWSFAKKIEIFQNFPAQGLFAAGIKLRFLHFI